MGFQFFNNNLGYNGQDIHIIRNGQAFPFYKLFHTDSVGPVNFIFRFPGTSIPRTYSNIELQELGFKVSIKASPYVASTGHKKLGSFFVEVTVDSQIAIIRVHVHGSIDKIWTTPDILSTRKGMKVQFGIHAKFNGNYYGDISFYPDFELKKIDSTLTVVKVNDAKTHIEFVDTPSIPGTALKTYNNSFEVTIPSYLSNSGTISTVKGSLRIQSQYGQLTLIGKEPIITGSQVNLDDSFNLLVLADGFHGAPFADSIEFNRYVLEIKERMMNTKSLPWNLFSNINFWCYHIESRETLGTVEGSYLILSESETAKTAKVVSLNSFINITTTLINDLELEKRYEDNNDLVELHRYEYFFILQFGIDISNFIPFSFLGAPTDTFPLINLPSEAHTKAKFLNLDQLCIAVGLPTIDDIPKLFTDKQAEWKALGFTTYPFTIKFTGETINASDYYLHPFVFELWKKLADTIVLEQQDTAFGITRNFGVRQNTAGYITGEELNFGYYKFNKWKSVNELISLIKYPDISGGKEFGKQFYDENGKPVLTDDEEYKEIDGESYIFKKVKNGNNIIALSRVPLLKLKGLNRGFTLPEKVGDNWISYTEHKTIASPIEAKHLVLDCTVVGGNATINKPKTYKLQDILTYSITPKIKNIVIHEISHNYLKDEYTMEKRDLKENGSASEITTETTYFDQSNIQTFNTLIDSEISPDNISGNKIKWGWPRISKIGVAISPITVVTGETGKFKIELDKESSDFEIGSTVLLRTKRLFNAINVRCTITSKNESSSAIVYHIQPVAGETLVVTNFKKGCLLILPYWTDTAKTKYLKLVHPKIIDRITNLNEALVTSDIINETPQEQKVTPKPNDSIPNMPGEDPVKLFGMDKSNIVGLYAGATGSLGGYDKGVYHPTGSCIMRNALDDTTMSFCTVCSYIIIDAIDPLKHIDLDNIYNLEYPNS